MSLAPAIVKPWKWTSIIRKSAVMDIRQLPTFSYATLGTTQASAYVHLVIIFVVMVVVVLGSQAPNALLLVRLVSVTLSVVNNLSVLVEHARKKVVTAVTRIVIAAETKDAAPRVSPHILAI